MNFMSIYANIYNWTRWISKFFLFYLPMYETCTRSPIISYKLTLYFGFGFIPTDDIEYAMTLDNDKASLSYKRNLNGFDIRMSSNYSLMSQIPEYGATLEIVNTF